MMINDLRFKMVEGLEWTEKYAVCQHEGSRRVAEGRKKVISDQSQ